MGHLGGMVIDGNKHKLWGFTFVLGYSRMLMAGAAVDQKLGILLRMHEQEFRQLGGIPQEILYDRMRTVWPDVDERGEIVWNPVFWILHAIGVSRRGYAVRIARRPRTKWKAA